MGKAQLAGTRADLFTVLVRLTLYARKWWWPASRKVRCFVHFYEALQLMTVAVSEDYASGDQFNLAVHTVLRAVGQPLLAAQSSGLPDYALAATVCAVIGITCTAALYVAVQFARFQDFEFQRVMSGQSPLFLHAPISVLVTVSLVLVEGLFVPVLVWTSSVDEVFYAALQGGFGTLACGCAFLMAEGRLRCRDFGAISRPLFSLYRKLVCWAFVAGTSIFASTSHRVMHELSYIVPGAFWIYEVFVKLPYHQDLLNKVEIAKGAGLVWTGLVMAAAGVNGLQGDSVTVLLVLTTSAVVAVVLMALQTYKARVAGKALVSYSFEFEMRLRWHIEVNSPKHQKVKDPAKVSKTMRRQMDTPVFDSLCRDAYARFSLDAHALMRLIDYFLLLKEWIFVKVMLCKLQTLPKLPLSAVDIGCYEILISAEIASIKSEYDASGFMVTSSNIEKVKHFDELMTLSMLRIAEVFQAPNLSASEMTKILATYANAMAQAKDMYEKLYQAIGDKKEFLVLYLSFLHFLREEDKIAALDVRLKQISQTLQSRQRQSEESLLFLDDMNTVFAISLEEASRGRIIHAKNTHVLGYMDSELVDSPCYVLIPKIAQDVHRYLFGRVYQYRHSSPIYSRMQTVYIVAKDGFLRRVLWKIRIVILEKGQLGALIAIRLAPDSLEFAFVENHYVQQSTELFANVMMANRAQDLLHSYILRLNPWRDGVPLLTVQGPFGSATFVTRTLRLAGAHGSRVLVMESQSLPTAVRFSTLGKSVAFVSMDASASKREAQMDQHRTQVAQELQSIRAIYRRHFSQRRAIKWILLLSVLSIPLSVVAQVGIIIDIEAQVADMSVDFEFIKRLSELRTQMQMMGVEARELHLRTAGIRTYRDAQTLSQEMLLRADSFATLAESLLTLSGEDSPVITKDNIVWWEARGPLFTFSLHNSVQIASMLSSRCKKLASAPVPDMQLVREVLRNTPGEAQRSLRAVIHTRIVYHEVNNEPDRVNLVLPLFILFYTAMAAVISAVVILLVSVSRNRHWIWRQLATVSADTIITFQLTVLQRMDEVHGSDLQFPRHRASRTLKYSVHPMLLALWAVALGIVGMSIGSFQFNYERAFMTLQGTQYNQPFVIYTTSMQHSLLATVIFWLRELTLPVEQRVHSLFPSNNQVSSPLDEVTEALELLASEEKALRGRHQRYSDDLSVSSTHFNFLFNPDHDSAPVPELMIGYVPGLDQLSDSVMACVCASEQSPGTVHVDCARAEAAAFALLNLTEANRDLYETDSNDYVTTSISTAIAINLGFSALAVCCVMLVLLPVAFSFRAASIREGELLPLILKMSEKETTLRSSQKATAGQ